MRSPNFFRSLIALAAVAALAATAAFAGGPLYLYDPANKIPYAWSGAYAPVYTDLGGLGPLSNEQADAMVEFSIGQWSAVPTSSFNGAVVGDISSIGLSDITDANLDSVLGVWNGGGVHVIYDADGSIFTSIFGSPYGILGVTIIEYVSDSSPAILEVTLILNGTSVPDTGDTTFDAAAFAGIVTHEFGHAINLAHSQTNGQIALYFEPWTGPAGCATPYVGTPSFDDMETMYPYSNVYASGIAESTIDVLDDMAAVSDIYPAAGWPAGHGTITGTVSVPLRATGPQKTPFTGTNVIARDLADPWRGAISAITGDKSQGLAGVDGTYTFNGLTPGHSYVVYVDGVLFGAFATPYPTVLPGPEEYWNDASESGNGVNDDRCAWTAITPAAGAPMTVDLTFNKVKGSPEFIPIDLPDSTITELSGDGNTGVGIWPGGVIRWTPNALDQLGGNPYSPQAGISHDGQTIAASVEDENGIQIAAIWRSATGWSPLGDPLPGSASCDNLLTSGWGVSNDQTVVGLDWLGCTGVTAFKWNSSTGMTDLGFLGTGNNAGSRANRISADATTVVGWDQAETGFWQGAIWKNGQESIVHQPPALCCDHDPVGCMVDTVGTATAVNPDGSIVVGEYYAVPQVYVDPSSGEEFHYCSNGAWKWTPGGGTEYLGDFLPDYSPLAQDVSDDGKVIVGVAFPFDFFLPRKSILWTPPTGFMDLQDFLARQGTFAGDWLLQVAGTVSGDGRTIGGFGYSPYAAQGFIVKMEKAVVCHAPTGNPSNKKTMDVSFPNGLTDHLAHGDTVGQCGNGM